MGGSGKSSLRVEQQLPTFRQNIDWPCVVSLLVRIVADGSADCFDEAFGSAQRSTHDVPGWLLTGKRRQMTGFGKRFVRKHFVPNLSEGLS